VGQPVSRLLGRVWVALAVTWAVVLVELVPLLGSSPAAGTDVVLVSLAMLALAAAVDAASWLPGVVPGSGVLSPTPNDDSPVMSGPATDPMHHPLAPRAPGLA
jgi:hypothetical protein